MSDSESVHIPRVLPGAFRGVWPPPVADGGLAPPPPGGASRRSVWLPPGRRDTDPRAARAPSGSAPNGAARAAPTTTTIDLTKDEDDEDDEPILIETHSVANAPSAAPARAPPTRPDMWVCLGIVYPSVECLYGLPPELQTDEHGAMPSSAEHKASWMSREFWAEYGYWPVSVHEEASAQGSDPLSRSTVLRAMPPARRGLAVSTLTTPAAPGERPQILNTYGTLSGKYSSVMEHYIQRRKLRTISRSKIVSRHAALAYTQSLEVLVFVPEAMADDVLAAFARARVEVSAPPTYRAADFPGEPRLLSAPARREDGMGAFSDKALATRGSGTPTSGGLAVVPSGSRGMTLSATCLGSVYQPQYVEEQAQKAQISAVYAGLRGGEDLAETDAGPLITTPLYMHQKQGLTFLLDCERARHFAELGEDAAPDAHISLWRISQRAHGRPVRFRNVVTQLETRRRPHICRGAVLADDMGLGKTITIIAAIAKTRDEARSFGASALQDSDAESDDEPQLLGDTVNRRTAERARREELRCRSRATLLVCPLSIIANWETQILEHWDPARRPSVYVYHGSGRHTDPAALADHDVVLTTYSTLGAEFANQSTWTAAAGRGDVDVSALALSDDDEEAESGRRRKRRRGESPNTCQRIEWFRIVLDEAHIIKESRTWQSKAVCNLSGARRICLTGTPVQNRLDDLYALVLFLRLEPFTDRGVWSRFCGDRKHFYLSQPRGRVEQPLDPTSLARVQTIMKFLTLRRMKSDKLPNGEPILRLPPRAARTVKLEWTDVDRTKYEKLHSHFREEFEVHVAEGTVGAHYATILHEILILRMMCDHAELVDESKDARRQRFDMADLSRAISEDGLTRGRAAELFSLLDASGMASCNACGAELRAPRPEERGEEDAAQRQPVITRCQHTFCTACFRGVVPTWPRVDRDATQACPCCSATLHLALDAYALTEPDVQRVAPADTRSKDVSLLMRMLDEAPPSPSTPPRKRGARALPSPAPLLDAEHLPPSWSNKLSALVLDLLPFSRCNPASALYDPEAPVLDHWAPPEAADEGSAQGAQPLVEVREYPPRAAKKEGDADGDAGEVHEPVKSVVFSQWTRMLDKIGAALDHARIRHAQLDGTMSRSMREQALEKFRTDPGVEVLLVSLRAGGFGLNLVSACRAYLMEPYWNPAVENQGLDRVHRLGQRRPVLTTKFIMSLSIEEQMLELQRRKTELANSVGDRRLSGEDAKAQRNEELKLLLA